MLGRWLEIAKKRNASSKRKYKRQLEEIIYFVLK